MAYGFFVESRAKRQITGLFGQYVPPELVDEMATDPDRYNMEPRIAELTCCSPTCGASRPSPRRFARRRCASYMNEYLTPIMR